MNPYEKYTNSKILTATPAQITLMLYDGAIKFGNLAKTAMENKEVECAHNNVMKVYDIVEALLAALDNSYPISKDFKVIYENILNLLTKANVSKNPADMEDALIELREIRNIWKEIMDKTNNGNLKGSA